MKKSFYIKIKYFFEFHSFGIFKAIQAGTNFLLAEIIDTLLKDI